MKFLLRNSLKAHCNEVLASKMSGAAVQHTSFIKRVAFTAWRGIISFLCMVHLLLVAKVCLLVFWRGLYYCTYIPVKVWHWIAPKLYLLVEVELITVQQSLVLKIALKTQKNPWSVNILRWFIRTIWLPQREILLIKCRNAFSKFNLVCINWLISCYWSSHFEQKKPKESPNCTTRISAALFLFKRAYALTWIEIQISFIPGLSHAIQNNIDFTASQIKCFNIALKIYKLCFCFWKITDFP